MWKFKWPRIVKNTKISVITHRNKCKNVKSNDIPHSWKCYFGVVVLALIGILVVLAAIFPALSSGQKYQVINMTSYGK